jgi:hypothetical protein
VGLNGEKRAHSRRTDAPIVDLGDDTRGFLPIAARNSMGRSRTVLRRCAPRRLTLP